MFDQGQVKYARWWEEKDTDLPRTVTGLVGLLCKRTRPLRRMDAFHAKLYSNHDVAGTGQSSATNYELMRGEDGRMRYQLCTSIVDTMHAMLPQTSQSRIT